MKLRAGAVAMAAGVLTCAGIAQGQTAAYGPRVGQYPDVIVSTVGDGDGILNYGTANGITAYAYQSVSCNIGTSEAIWIDTTTGQFGNQHPVIGCQLYRLFNNRFEQIGIGWLKHGFCAADAPSCTNLGPAGSTYAPNGSCDWLGRYATDTYSASLNGGQGSLGPRSEVNPWTGVYPYPWIRQGNNSSSCLNKRMLARKSDMDPNNYPRYNATTAPTGARYFGEIVYIATDEWPDQRVNNYSYRAVNIGSLATGSGCTTEQGYGLTFTGGTIPMKVAMEAWKAADPTVKIAYADAPNDGRFAVGCKVTNRGNGTYQYEYAVMNMNSDRGAGSFMVPKSASAALEISETAFRGVEYHSGEPYSLKPWTMQVDGPQVTFFTESYDTNVNANALRWSTLYNFRFVANTPPRDGAINLGLFKPAVVDGDPSTLTVAGLLVPSDPVCPADFNRTGGVTVQDIFDFLAAWFTGSPLADFNGLGGVTVQDIFDFLAAWFTGCP